MIFNESIAISILGRAIFKGPYDYSLKSFLGFGFLIFMLLIFSYKLIAKGINVETILKSKSFYVTYLCSIAVLVAVFSYKNFYTPSYHSVLDTTEGAASASQLTTESGKPECVLVLTSTTGAKQFLNTCK